MQAFELETPPDADIEAGVECIFGGATRGGKSHLARVMLTAYCLKIPNLQCILVRKKQQDILDNHVYGPNGFKDLLGPLCATGQVSVTQDGVWFDNGSRITFKHCQDERQFDTAQGITSHILVVDEATQISERLLRTFRGWCTMTVEMKNALPDYFKRKLPRILYTANPIGPSVGYFRRNFIKPRPSYDLSIPASLERVGAFYRTYIPSKVEDNPSENAAATRGRMMEMGDVAIAQALLEGDWDAPVGDFFPEWDDKRHITEDFIPPHHWRRFRTFDWGSTDPFAVGWWCVSDGESFQYQGSTKWFPKDSIILYREWYGCDPIDPSQGLGMRNKEIAQGILAMSEKGFELVPTLTDSLPFQDRGSEYNIAEIFGLEGVPLTLAATARVQGWSEVRGRLLGVQFIPEDAQRTPMIYACRSCKYSIEYIPALPRHPNKSNDAAEHGESTHCADMWRYACMNRVRANEKVEKQFNPNDMWMPTEKALHNIPTFDEALAMIKKHNKPKSSW